MKNKKIAYMVSVEYFDSDLTKLDISGFVELEDEEDAVDVKQAIRASLGIPNYGGSIKILCMCPMLHLSFTESE